MTKVKDPIAAFIEATCVPIDESHASWQLQEAEAILAAHPEVATANVYTAAILGHPETVNRFIADDPSSATAKGGPRGWDALTYLCFSKYLRLDPARSEGLVRAATVLLDNGASVNTGFYSHDYQPPQLESAIYGAAGVAHHAELTRLLLEHGADPNDGETPYHAPETYDNRAVKVLVESGKLNEDSLATILLRKCDWHDYDGIHLLLESGADPNRILRWGVAALHQAARRDNWIKVFELLLDYGADPGLVADGKSVAGIAARRGRGDVLELLERRGFAIELEGVERLLAPCARNDAATVRSIADSEPDLVRAIVAEGGKLLAEFAGNDNKDGVERLLDLGVEVSAVSKEGDGYFGVATNSMAIHSAAWRASHSTVKLLIERGTPVNETDGKGRTPLVLAVRACVDSYWTRKRSPESVAALLEAGATLDGVVLPSGYPEVDELLERHAK